MIGGVGDARLVTVEPAARRDVRFDTDDGLDMCGSRLAVELDRAEHIAVVGDRHGVHADFLTLLEKPFESDSAIEQ